MQCKILHYYEIHLPATHNEIAQQDYEAFIHSLAATHNEIKARDYEAFSAASWASSFFFSAFKSFFSPCTTASLRVSLQLQ